MGGVADIMKKAAPENRYKELQKELTKVGGICTGSVMSLYRTCGKPTCGCKADPDSRHGPYYIWTRKENGKTVTRSLSKQQAEVCRRYIENQKQLEQILDEMKRVSVEMITAAAE